MEAFVAAGHTPLGWWGVAVAAGIAWAAYRVGSLSLSGVWAAWGVGSAILALGGWAWGVLLLAFFVSSSAWSRWAAGRKRATAEKFAKGSRRDAGQVLANGGLAAVLAMVYAWQPGPRWWAAFAAALAAAAADTWATEIGVLHPRPRHILSGRVVAPGTSGGVSPWGWAAAAGGAGLLAALAGLLAPGEPNGRLALGVWLGGLLGSVVDSVLGATVQAMYYCPACDKETEQHPFHRCGTRTQHRRGWPWLDNDGVNAVSIVVAALVGFWLGG